MRTIQTFMLVAVLVSTCTEALTVHKRTDGPPRVLGLPIQRRSVLNPLERDRLRRRSGTVQVSLDNEETLYFANVTMGTPAQSLRLHIDTGSSDLWVNTPSSSFCQVASNGCSSSGTYKANDSSSYSYLASNFNISYVDGSGASGDYVTDTLKLGGISVSKLQFGIGYTSSSSEGILGIGYQINEVQVGRAGGKPYNNLPAAMKAQNFIAANAYSLYLNDLDASTGSVLFGGIDTDQFTGTLATLPVQTSNGQYSEFLITLTGLALGSTTIAKNQAVAVLLDSGSSLTYLPNTMTEAIYQAVGAQYDSKEGAAFVACSLSSNTTALEFTFSSPKISVSMSELVLPVSSSTGQQLTFSDGTPACIFGIAPAGSSTSVLGDTFIRSAYLVYDLDNNQISIAQTSFNATKSNILEIASGTTGVPSATAVANSVAASGGTGNSNSNTAGSGTVTVSGLGSTSTGRAAAETAAPYKAAAALAVAGLMAVL